MPHFNEHALEMAIMEIFEGKDCGAYFVSLLDENY